MDRLVEHRSAQEDQVRVEVAAAEGRVRALRRRLDELRRERRGLSERRPATGAGELARVEAYRDRLRAEMARIQQELDQAIAELRPVQEALTGAGQERIAAERLQARDRDALQARDAAHEQDDEDEAGARLRTGEDG